MRVSSTCRSTCSTTFSRTKRFESHPHLRSLVCHRASPIQLAVLRPTHHRRRHDLQEMIFMSYAGGSLVLLLICMATGEMSEGLAFIDQHGASRINIVIFIYAACGFCGVSCVAALTKRFGALTAALTTTARKVSARHTGAGPQAHRHHRQLCPLNPPPRPLCSLPAYHGTGDHDITLVFDLPEAVCVRARVRRGAIYLRPSGAVAATRGRRTKAASYHRAS